jgi:uncharacterized LabA/DUF88 family protein
MDGSNLYHALEENCGRMDLDFKAFIAKVSGERQLFRAYYYNILQDAERRGFAYQEQQKFLATLYNTPLLEIRLGTSKYRGETLVEKGVDIMMATDILQYAWRDLYDVAVLVSGDGDFAYALQAVKDLGKHVEVAAFPSNLSHELAQTSDFRLLFDRAFFDDLWASGRERGGVGRGNGSEGQAHRRRRRGRRPGPARGIHPVPQRTGEEQLPSPPQPPPQPLVSFPASIPQP